MLLIDERRKLIFEELVTEGTVYVSKLAKQYDVTYETIRKDLTYLEQKGLLIKSHGGATLKQGAIENPFHVREKENISYKKAIAKKALELIPAGSSMIVGTGSSTLELANLLSLRSGFKIFTDSLPVASVLLQSDNQVFLFGGELRKKSSSVFGGWAVSMIQDVKVDMCFLGTDGFSNLSGPSTPSSSDAFVDKTIIAHAEKKYILGDHTKFQRSSLFKICDWADITALITNPAADAEGVARVALQTSVLFSE
ncbi:DeoR/GlpR family DNA-binding transcription regulator [Cedecea neteri]|uniref:DeoR/GlpR family DNA-binding transcription regulator n=1 Tax=Cedecea TaxID=158483 RepID=UPI000A0ABD01|nr:MULTISPECIES: DeoR/GlpR family DNA-binding transcription regulator [Cedecea]WNJ79014.1 DeoR/GlpR family DNA-binding transcription regulator [Cedecea neteri]SMG49405.1 transcriptional regulator, DeoR family [Cedecea sp. NFIX57]